MKKEILYTLKAPYREDFNVWGYHFGNGDKTACIIGSMRGNEVQQLYVCSQVIKKLQELEEKGAIAHNREILVIPSINHYSINSGKRFWSSDNSDINRMFPGYKYGETTQRIAAGVFEQVKDYMYGIQFASFYIKGEFVPHVRMMETGHQNSSLANLFGLPYVVIRKPEPYDTSTLNYNWQNWDTSAFSIYTSETDKIDPNSATQAVAAVLRFLTRMGIVKYQGHSGYIANVIKEDELINVSTSEAGIFRVVKGANDEVEVGDVLAEILHPYEGNVIIQILSPVDGIIFFAHNEPLVMENTVIYKIIPKLHK